MGHWAILRYSAASGSFQISACNQLRHHRSGSTYPAGQRTDNVLRYFSARSPASKWFLLVPRTEEKHSKMCYSVYFTTKTGTTALRSTFEARSIPSQHSSPSKSDNLRFYRLHPSIFSGRNKLICAYPAIEMLGQNLVCLPGRRHTQ